MVSMPDRRLSLDPVLPYIDRHTKQHPNRLVGDGVAGRAWALADLLDSSRASALRVLAQGTIGERTADRLASRLGAHPANLWGDEWWEGTEAMCHE